MTKQIEGTVDDDVAVKLAIMLLDLDFLQQDALPGGGYQDTQTQVAGPLDDAASRGAINTQVAEQPGHDGRLWRRAPADLERSSWFVLRRP